MPVERWTSINVLAWAMSWIIGGFIGAQGFGSYFWPLVVGASGVNTNGLGHYLFYAGFAGVATGLIGGAITAIPLARLLQPHPSQADRQ